MNNTQSKIIEESKLDYQDAFNMFDKNGDGMITSDKLLSFLTKCNYDINISDVKEIIRKVDTKGNDKIDFADFVKAMETSNMNSSPEEDILSIFRLFDRDRSGMISKIQMQSILKQFGEMLTDEEISEMIIEADVDGDGFINYEEFVRMMMFH